MNVQKIVVLGAQYAGKTDVVFNAAQSEILDILLDSGCGYIPFMFPDLLPTVPEVPKYTYNYDAVESYLLRRLNERGLDPDMTTAENYMDRDDLLELTHSYYDRAFECPGRVDTYYGVPLEDLADEHLVDVCRLVGEYIRRDNAGEL
jgi:hypothetical protein